MYTCPLQVKMLHDAAEFSARTRKLLPEKVYDCATRSMIDLLTLRLDAIDALFPDSIRFLEVGREVYTQLLCSHCYADQEVSPDVFELLDAIRGNFILRGMQVSYYEEQLDASCLSGYALALITGRRFEVDSSSWWHFLARSPTLPVYFHKWIERIVSIAMRTISKMLHQAQVMMYMLDRNFAEHAHILLRSQWPPAESNWLQSRFDFTLAPVVDEHPLNVVLYISNLTHPDAIDKLSKYAVELAQRANVLFYEDSIRPPWLASLRPEFLPKLDREEVASTPCREFCGVGSRERFHHVYLCSTIYPTARRCFAIIPSPTIGS